MVIPLSASLRVSLRSGRPAPPSKAHPRTAEIPFHLISRTTHDGARAFQGTIGIPCIRRAETRSNPSSPAEDPSMIKTRCRGGVIQITRRDYTACIAVLEDARMVKVLIACSLLGVSCLASAQVFKCIDDKTKKITFSDVPCPKTASGGYVDVRPTNQFDGGHLRQHSAQERAADARRAYERELEAQQEAMRPRAAAPNPMAEACAEAMKGLLDSRAARNRAAVLCGQPQTIDEPAPMPAPAAGPSRVGKCDANGCWGPGGERYNHRSGDRFTGTDGRPCRLHNGQMFCN